MWAAQSTKSVNELKDLHCLVMSHPHTPKSIAVLPEY